MLIKRNVKIKQIIFVLIFIMFSLSMLSAICVKAASKTSINTAVVSLRINETYKLSVNGIDRDVSWSSSNEKVAVVNANGIVTGKSAGTSEISAKVGTNKYSCKLTVKSSKIIIEKKISSLDVGDTAELKLLGTLAKPNWTSSNDRVAKIDKKTGNIEAFNEGTAKITAELNNKNYTLKFSILPSFNSLLKSDMELQDAYDLGIIPKEWENNLNMVVTAKEADKLILKVMTLKKGTVNNVTKKWLSESSDNIILRKDFAHDIYRAALENYYGIKNAEQTWKYDAFDYAYTLSKYHDRYGEASPCIEFKQSAAGKKIDMDVFAVAYATLQIDQYTAAVIMDVDDKGYFRIDDKLTRKEAVLAAKRLYNTYFSPKYASIDAVKPITLTNDQMSKALAMPDAAYNNLPKWHGTALDNKTYSSHTHHTGTMYSKEDFEILHDLGFNFTRLFISHDLLLNLSNTDNIEVSMTQLENLDDAIRWAAEYGVHVCVCLYDMPGFAGATFDIAGYTNPKLLDNVTKVYQMLSRRYKYVPSNILSFNLFNEPWGLKLADEKIYVKAVRKVSSAIREESRDRLIFVDGLDGSHIPVYSLAEDKVAQSFHMYDPDPFIYSSAAMGGFSASQDAWFEGKVWPLPYVNGWLRDTSMYMKLQGDFSTGQEVRLLIDRCTDDGKLELYADDLKVASVKIKANETQNGKVITLAKLTGKASELKIVWNGEGDIQIESVALIYPDKSKTGTLYFGNDGTRKILYNKIVIIGCVPYGTEGSSTIKVATDGSYTNPSQKELIYDKSYIAARIEPWLEFSRKTGVDIMIQEWGVTEYTTKKATLSYMNDVLSVLRENDLSWNLWSDVWQYIDTNRFDVKYEIYRGKYKLDRDMVTTLQKYMMN